MTFINSLTGQNVFPSEDICVSGLTEDSRGIYTRDAEQKHLNPKMWLRELSTSGQCPAAPELTRSPGQLLVSISVWMCVCVHWASPESPGQNHAPCQASGHMFFFLDLLSFVLFAVRVFD